MKKQGIPLRNVVPHYHWPRFGKHPPNKNCPHFLMELHAPLCAAVPNARWVEYIPQLDDLTGERMTIRDGRAIPSSRPGLGIDWDFDAIAAMTVDGSHSIHL